MPVMVTGAEDGLGVAAVERLLPSGGEVRVFLDGTVATAADAGRLRVRGCKVAVGELDDEGHLEAALAQAHTVVHCWGGPVRAPMEHLTVGATLARALLGAGVRRLVWVRELASDVTNPYLAALDSVAALFDELPIETVTLATAVRYGPDDDLTRRLAAGWLSGTSVDPDAAHAPIHLRDVARAIAGADRQRTTVAELRVRLALLGPERMPLREFLGRLGASGPQRAEAADGVAPAWVVDWLSRPAAAPPSGRPAMTMARGRERLPPGPGGDNRARSG